MIVKKKMMMVMMMMMMRDAKGKGKPRDLDPLDRPPHRRIDR